MEPVKRDVAELARGGGSTCSVRTGDLLPRVQRRSTGSIWECERAASAGWTSSAAVFDVHSVIRKVDLAADCSRPRAGISRVAICKRHREVEKKRCARDWKRRA